MLHVHLEDFLSNIIELPEHCLCSTTITKRNTVKHLNQVYTFWQGVRDCQGEQRLDCWMFPFYDRGPAGIVLIECCFLDVDKLGIIWSIHEEQVNYLGNLLLMLARCMLPVRNKACIFFFTFRAFLMQFIVHFSQTVDVSGDYVVAYDAR